MAIKGNGLTINLLAWDTANNIGKISDGANISLYIIKDGGTATPVTNAISEPSSANIPGVYEITLTSTEMNANFITIGGNSSTANVVVYPVFIQTEQGELSNINSNILSTSADVNTTNTNVLSVSADIQNLNDISTSDVDTIITNNSKIVSINQDTSGTNTLINGLNDISTSDVDTTITNNSVISTINSNISSLNDISTSDVDTIITNNSKIVSINQDTSGTNTLINGLNDISTSDVLTQVNSALDTPISELTQAIPTATPTIRTGIILQYMDLRNKRTATSSEYGIYNDAGVKIAKATLSDDGTTFTKSELISGA